VIVDNRGDYPRIGDERVITPRGNLGWAGGSELGFRVAFSEGYSHAMTLNNDTRLSKGFVAALLDSRLPDDAGVVGPSIDHGFPCAEAEDKISAADYVPRPFYRAVPAVEGTALMLSRECWLTIGGLNLHTFAPYGWGIDLDLAVRALEAGYGVYITEMAYINHFGHKTANATIGRRRYELMANAAKVRGMRKLHGGKWRRHVPPGTLRPPPWRKLVASQTYTSIGLGDEPDGQSTHDGRAQACATWYW
jgi:GT2 family glycosyltransferase